jgi:hypothetical protein
MVSLLLGIAAAAAASTFYSLGIAVQALDARDVHEEHALRLTLLTQLARRVRWLAGTGLTILGWPLQIVALLLAPLVVVQPALAAGLLVLLVAGERMLGEHAGPREHAATAALVLGVAGIAVVAPDRSTAHTDQLTLILVLVALGAAATLPYLLRLLGRAVAGATMIGAGFGFAWSALATKLLADAAANGHWLTALGWALGSGVASGVAVISEMSALQLRPAIQVAPVVFVVQTAVPVATAPVLLHEHFLHSAASGSVLVLSLLVLLAGAAVLARSPLLLALTAPDPEGLSTNEPSSASGRDHFASTPPPTGSRSAAAPRHPPAPPRSSPDRPDPRPSS